MNDLIKPFTREKNQFIFCVLGFFWVSNLRPLLEEQTSLLRVLVYPIFILLLAVFTRLFFCVKKNKPYMDNIAFNILLCFVVLGCVCIVRGIPLHMDKTAIRGLLFNLSGAAVVWVMPLTILFSIKGQFWMTWLAKMKYIVVFGILYVSVLMLTALVTGDMLEHKSFNSTDFLFIAPFLVIWSRFKMDSADLLLGCFGVAVIGIWMFLVNERFAIAYAGLMCLFYMITIFFEKYKLNLKINILVLFLTISIVSGVLFSQVSFFRSYVDRYIFQGEILKDTRIHIRSGERLGAAVTQDMFFYEKIFGKGIDGKYVWGSIGWPPRPYIRDNVEIGYKQLILKGGYTMQMTFLAISLYAAYLAIFRSRNRITRYLAYIIIARLIIMTTAMIPRVGFEYFMYWIIVGGCLSSELRSFSDDDILQKCAGKRIIIKW